MNLWRLKGCSTRSRAGGCGFTLPEVVVAVGVLTLAVGLVGSGMFQALSMERYWKDDAVATWELRRAAGTFVNDAMVAKTTDLQDGAGPAGSVTLWHTDEVGLQRLVSYSAISGDLVRESEGITTVVARGVVTAGFSLSGKLMSFDLEVEADRGTTESMELQTFLRMFGQ